MIRLFMTGFLVLAGLALAQPAQSETEAPIPFDTEEYLTACTTRVPNVELSLLMNQRCVSTARDLCNFSLGAQEMSRCLGVVTGWLQKDNARIRLAVPKVEVRFAELSQTDIFSLGASAPPDCTEARVEGGSTEVICAYQQAISTWLGFRILELSDLGDEE